MIGSLAITDVLLFDGASFKAHQTVAAEEGVITEVGPSREISPPPGAKVIEGGGLTLLPGFIDCHVHIELHDPIEVLIGGVTTARDLGWPAKEIFPLAKRLSEDESAGPSLLVSGPMLTAPGGYPTEAGWAPRGTGVEVDSVEEARQTVSLLATAGASVIKVAQEPRQGPVLEIGVLSAIVDQAHSFGLNVTSHLGSLQQLDLALEAGIDELAHGLWSDEEIPPDIIERMIASSMVVIPTLHIDPSPARIHNLRSFLEAGGMVLYGTDMGNSGPPPGVDAKELELMMEAGMGVEQVLRSATSDAARYLGMQRTGVIRAGMKADLLLVEGDVSQDLNVLETPLLCLRGR